MAVLILVSGLLTEVQAKGLVLPTKRREAVLQQARALTDMENIALQKELSSLAYPFALEKPEEPKPEVATTDDSEVVAKPVKIYTEKEVLEAFSSNFKPVGMMARGDVNYLIVDVGGTKRPIAENSLVRFNFEDKPYNVRLGEVTDDDYTLSLGNAKTVRKLNESYDDETIKRFAPNTQE